MADPLAGTEFLCRDVRASRPTVLHTSGRGLQPWEGAPLHPDLAARFSAGPVLALSLKGKNLEGRLFALDKPGMTSDDLVLGAVVARQVVARMDYFYLLRQLQQVVATEERIRLARDLHDGVLQSLTATALQLETIGPLLEKEPEAARERLLEIQRLIAAEQRDLRSFVQQLKPAPLTPLEGEASLVGRLKELAQRMERQWGLRVTLDVRPIDGGIPDGLSHEIYRIVHEALINTARHAGASTGRVEIAGGGDRVRIVVSDDGRGFPFHGRYDHAALTAKRLGPVSLRERIASLGGSLAVELAETGARLEITLPLARPGA